jgi:hypothetical protein
MEFLASQVEFLTSQGVHSAVQNNSADNDAMRSNSKVLSRCRPATQSWSNNYLESVALFWSEYFYSLI